MQLGVRVWKRDDGFSSMQLRAARLRGIAKASAASHTATRCEPLQYCMSSKSDSQTTELRPCFTALQ